MEKIKANMILEIMGRPKEHILQALTMLVEKLSKEQGISLEQQTIHEVVEVPNSKDLYTTFAEVNLELDSLLNYYAVMFSYMPANIEIISPEKVVLKNDEMNLFSGKLMQRLHDYDAIAKKMIGERDVLVAKLREVAPHLFKKKEVAKVEEIKEEGKSQKVKSKKKKSKKN